MSEVASKTTRGVLITVVVAALIAVVGVGAFALTSGGSTGYEVWSLDQGTDRIHIYDQDHAQVSVIDVSPRALQAVNPNFDPEVGRTVPHMIDFDSEDRYAFIAATAGAATIVLDTVQREVVAVLETGAGSHMAAVTPDDDAVWVAAIGAQQLVEIPLDLSADEPDFTIGRTIDVSSLLADTGYDWPSYSPVCHDYDAQGRAWITLGPGIDQGGLFVFDTDKAEVVHAYDPTVVRANCGIGFTDDQSHAVANWSGEFGADVEDGEGEWYVFDTSSFELLQADTSDGIDAHGIRLTPDGDVFWQVNRGSDNGQIIDATTFEVIGELDAGTTPDILDFSPDGRFAYITQRGPTPLSGDPHVAVGTAAGTLIVDVETTEHVSFIPTPEVRDIDGDVINDVHGIGVRTTTGDERVVAAAPASAGGVKAQAFNCHIVI